VPEDYPIRGSFLAPERAADYDRNHARTWGQRFRNATELRLLRRVLAQLVPADALLLDVPCGTGRHAGAYVEWGYRVVGLDVSPAMAGYAAARPGLSAPGFRAAVGEVERLPLANDAVELAVSVRLLRHLPVDVRYDALAELARVGRRGALCDLLLREGAVSWVKRAREGARYTARRPRLREVRRELSARGLRIADHWTPRPWTQQRFVHVVQA